MWCCNIETFYYGNVSIKDFNFSEFKIPTFKRCRSWTTRWRRHCIITTRTTALCRVGDCWLVSSSATICSKKKEIWFDYSRWWELWKNSKFKIKKMLFYKWNEMMIFWIVFEIFFHWKWKLILFQISNWFFKNALTKSINLRVILNCVCFVGVFWKFQIL